MGCWRDSPIGFAALRGLAADLLLWAAATSVAACLAGAAVAFGLGQALSVALDAAVGRPGEYDALIQLRQDAAAQARAEIEALLARQLPGARVRWGPSAAGSAALLVDLPPRLESTATFEGLDGVLRAVAGYVAWVPLVEPSVTLQAVHPSVLERAKSEAAHTAGVRYAFVHGRDLVVVAERPSRVPEVLARLRRWADGFRVYRLAPRSGSEPSDARELARRVGRQLPHMRVVYAGRATGASPPLGAWAGELRELVLAYATVARIEPAPGMQQNGAPAPPSLRVGDRVRVGPLNARVVQSEPGRALAVVLDEPPPPSRPLGPSPGMPEDTSGRWSGARPERWPVVKDGVVVGEATLGGTRVELEQALARAETLLGRLGQAAGQAAGALEESAEAVQQALHRLRWLTSWFEGGGPPGNGAGPWDALVALALRTLLAGGDSARASPAPAGDGRAAGLERALEVGRRLQEVQAQLRSLGTQDASTALQGVRRLRASLPGLSGEQALALLEALDRLEATAPEPGLAELVVRGDPPPAIEDLRRAAEVAGAGGRVYAAPAAVVTPSPRGAVLALLERARASVGLLGAVTVVAYSLLNDWACVAAALQESVRGLREPRRRKLCRGLAAAGGLTGALVAAAAAAPVGAGHGVMWVAAALAGAAAGVAATGLAGRLAQVPADSVEAARAFGLDLRGLVWEVVAPQARPWLLAWMARGRRVLAPHPFEGPGRLAPQGGGKDRAAPVPASHPVPGRIGAAAALEARSLVRRFGERRALDGFSLSVASGEVVALMGPSGCGKSTALRCLAGLCEPDEGEVRLFGVDLWAAGAAQREALRRRVAIVFQRPQLVRHLTVADNVALPLVAAGTPLEEARERAMVALEAVGLRHAAGRLAEGLSGGEGQRAAIARALVREPEIMLWDEPTAHLDPVLVADLLALVQELAASLRTTMLIATHEVRFALRVARRLVLADAGRVVEEGIPEAVLRQPRSEVGRRFAALMAL